MRKPLLLCPDWGSDGGRKNPGDRGSVLPALLQVNLLRKMWVTGVVTQGASRAGSAEYVKTFKVAYSNDGHQFQFIQAAGQLGEKVRFVVNPEEGLWSATPGGQCCLRAPKEARVPGMMNHKVGFQVYLGSQKLGSPDCVFVFSCSVMSDSCGPTDCSLLGSSVYGISQTRILEWVAISFSKGSSQLRDQTHVSCIGRWILYH